MKLYIKNDFGERLTTIIFGSFFISAIIFLTVYLLMNDWFLALVFSPFLVTCLYGLAWAMIYKPLTMEEMIAF